MPIYEPGLDELFAGRWREEGCPVEAPVRSEAVYYLTARGRYRFPFVPPPLRNHGGHVVTLSNVVRWLCEKVEALGVTVFPGFPAAEILWDGDRVAGARTADLGIDRAGNPREGFTPGAEVRARVTVFGEGEQSVAVSEQHVAELIVGQPSRARDVVRRLDHHLVPAIAGVALEQSAVFVPVAVSQRADRRELVGHHPQPPARAVGRRVGCPQSEHLVGRVVLLTRAERTQLSLAVGPVARHGTIKTNRPA